MSYATLDGEVDALKTALKKIRTVLAKRSQGDEVPDLPVLLQQYMTEAVANNSKKDPHSHPRCVEFRKKVCTNILFCMYLVDLVFCLSAHLKHAWKMCHLRKTHV